MTSSALHVAAGGVVLRHTDAAGLEVLMVGGSRHEAHFWGYPKGTQEPDEPLELTALREIREETGVMVQLLALVYISKYSYTTRKGITRPKEVTYYLARVLAEGDGNHDDEYQQVVWLPVDAAQQRFSYDSDRHALENALEFVNSNPLYQQLLGYTP